MFSCKATIEYGFSSFQREKNLNHSNFIDLSLEGIFKCKQYISIETLKN